MWFFFPHGKNDVLVPSRATVTDEHTDINHCDTFPKSTKLSLAYHLL